MASKVSTFDRAVSQIRTAVRRRLRTRESVSSLDISSVAPSVRGALRGAVVRAAFLSLLQEGVMSASTDSVRNPQTRNRVTVYRRSSR